MNWPGGRRYRDRRRSNAPSWRCTGSRTNVLSGRGRPCCVELGSLVVRLKVVTLVLMRDISSSSGMNEEECRTCMRTGGRRRCWMDRNLPTLCHHGHGSKKSDVSRKRCNSNKQSLCRSTRRATKARLLHLCKIAPLLDNLLRFLD